jgi:hypothetical protein
MGVEVLQPVATGKECQTMKFQEVPQFTRESSYRVNIGWSYLSVCLGDYVAEGCDLDPDFQRAHVWTEAQQVAYVEYVLRGGRSGRDIYFNATNWMGSGALKNFVLVDGKQRLNAVTMFMNGKIRAFGQLFSEFGGPIRLSGPDFVFHVNTLATRKEVLTWYLEMNTGGTPHTEAEINKVREMLKG